MSNCQSNWNSMTDFVGTWKFYSSAARGQKVEGESFEIMEGGSQLVYRHPGLPEVTGSASYTPAQGQEPAHIDIEGQTFAFIPDGCVNDKRKLLVVNAGTLQAAGKHQQAEVGPTETDQYIEEDQYIEKDQ